MKGELYSVLKRVRMVSIISSSGYFLLSYRLLSEHKFVDSRKDVYRAYIFLVGARGVKPQDIVLARLSSGAGLQLRLL